MKKIISVLMALTMLLSAVLLVGCGETKKDVYTIGICQLVTHDALDAATQGFKDALTEKLGADKVVFDFQNAANDINACPTIMNNFVTKKVDLIMANATPALQAAYSATNSIPILGTSVTEYGVALGIENFTGTVGSNVSGTSDLAPLDQQAAMITELFPDTKTVGILYCNAEPNSKYQVDVITAELAKKNVTVKPFAFSDSNDVASVTTAACADSDVLYIPTDNTAATCKDTIGNIVLTAKKPVITGEQGICVGCGVATLSISYYDLGYKTGEMAAEILQGGDITKMAIEYAPATKMYNKAMADALGVTIPEGYTEIK